MLDYNHTFEAVDGTVYTVQADGFSRYEAAGIVVASVVSHCVRNWPLLVDYASSAPNTSVSVAAAVQ